MYSFSKQIILHVFLRQFSVEMNLTFSTFTLSSRSYKTSNQLFLSKILSETPGALFVKIFYNELVILQNTIYFKPSNFSKRMLFYCVNYYRANCQGERNWNWNCAISTKVVFVLVSFSYIYVNMQSSKSDSLYLESNIGL
jgi:hypothetical protein